MHGMNNTKVRNMLVQ